MTEEWKVDQWTIRSFSVLKSQDAYKVTIEYEKVLPDGKHDGFVGYFWRKSGPSGKPTGVTWLHRDKTSVIIHWWPRIKAHHSVPQLCHSLKRPLAMDDETDAIASASAAVNSMPAETGRMVEEIPAPTTSCSESSESLENPQKHIRSTEGARLPEDPRMSADVGCLLF